MRTQLFFDMDGKLVGRDPWEPGGWRGNIVVTIEIVDGVARIVHQVILTPETET